MCNESGGIIDDLMIYRLAENEFLVIVNAGGRDGDLAWIHEHAPTGVTLIPRYDDMAMIAVQGPNAVQKVASLLGFDAGFIKHFQIREVESPGGSLRIARTGYTGEDGIEIFVPAGRAAALWNDLLEAGIEPCGLGARDTLRLEAALPLYGNDIDLEHNPLEAGLGWTVKLAKGEFIGKAALASAKAAGLARRLVCFEMLERGIARHGYPVWLGGAETGVVTSGSYTPTVDKAIGMAYVPAASAAIGTEIAVLIRDKQVPARIVPRPFYKRG
jgi:aminomethyltransferase